MSDSHRPTRLDKTVLSGDLQKRKFFHTMKAQRSYYVSATAIVINTRNNVLRNRKLDFTRYALRSAACPSIPAVRCRPMYTSYCRPVWKWASSPQQSPTTTNAAESFHSHLSADIKTPHPNMYVFVQPLIYINRPFRTCSQKAAQLLHAWRAWSARLHSVRWILLCALVFLLSFCYEFLFCVRLKLTMLR